jgi:predicted kinase
MLTSEELTLRARLDLDQGRDREAALQLLVSLDAALAELQTDPTAEVLSDRLSELRGQRDAVARAAQAALSGPLSEADRETVDFTLSRIEAALRARAVANA